MSESSVKMTSYQRCLAVIEGRLPDTVPAYTPTICSDVASKLLGRQADTGAPAIWYAEACAWAAGEQAWQEFDAKVMEDRLALHRLLGSDIFRFPWRRNVRPTARIDEFKFLCGDPDGVHQIWRWDAEVMNFLKVKDTAPPVTADDWPELARRRRAEADEPGRLEQARQAAGEREARLQAELGEEFLVPGSAGGISLGVGEAGLMATALYPEACAAMLDCNAESNCAALRGLGDKGVKVAHGGGDMADKNGPLYSPRVFRELMLPRLRRMADAAREAGVHYVWRTDGKLWSVADMIFEEAGVPGYGEVDYDATMTTAAVRERYPDLVIWANASGDLLCRGIRSQVYDHAMELLEASGGRNYFHGVSNTILPGTPPENVLALFEARDAYRVPGAQ